MSFVLSVELGDQPGEGAASTLEAAEEVQETQLSTLHRVQEYLLQHFRSAMQLTTEKKTFTIFPCVRAVKTTEITLQGLHGPEAWKTILKLREGLASLLNRLISSIVIFWIKSPIFYLPIIETVTMSEKVW